MYKNNNYKKQPEKEKKKPVKTFRAGLISATIWENSRTDENNKEYTTKTITIQRNYLKDMNDEKSWARTNSVPTADLPRVNLVCQQAYAFLTLNTDNQDN
jgi:hypothetical protein